MSKKNVDKYNRFRGYTTVFRMSVEEHGELIKRVALSGLTKQDYMIKKALNKEVVVGNKRTYKALRNQLEEFNQLLKEYLQSRKGIEQETLELMYFTMKIVEGLNDKKDS